MKEWIEARRAELKAQQEQAIGMANQAAGAMKMLDLLEEELKPKVEQEPPPNG